MHSRKRFISHLMRTGLTIVGLASALVVQAKTSCGPLLSPGPAATQAVAVGLPAEVLPHLATAIRTAFEEGPMKWVPVAAAQPGKPAYQRGLSGSGAFGEGAREAMDVLTGQKLKLARAVLRMGPHPEGLAVADEAQLESTARFYAAPLAVRGTTDEVLRDPPYRSQHPGEGQLPIGSLISGQITELGLFYNPGYLEPSVIFNWARQYLELYGELSENGMLLNPSSRGAQFLSELKLALAQVDPAYAEIYEALLQAKQQDKKMDLAGKYRSFALRNSQSFKALVEVLKRYSNLN